ncbi:retrovirus-related pol polyprotein from transposon TNT 1-94, partial [Tanacetum coccineum]
MKMQQVQVNTMFLNALPLEWSKFVTDVKLAKSLYTTNYDQLYAYLSQHARHANEVRIMRKRYPDPLALVANSQTLYNPSQSLQHSRSPIVIAKEHVVISVIDDKETLILVEESRSKMLDKQNDPISIEKKIKISPIDYSQLNKIKEDFGKRFVTKKRIVYRTRIDNDQLLNQIMSQEIVHIVVNSVDTLDVKKSCVNDCKKHCISLELATQLNQAIFQRENSSEKLNVPTFNQLFEINELKAQSQEKDTVIRKLKDRIKSLSAKDSVEKVKKDIDEIETISIELEHSVAKLLSKNENLRKEREHLKSIYIDQFDSIRKTRIQSKEQSLKNELRKLKGKNVINTAVSKPNATIAPGMFKFGIEPISPRLKNNKDAYEVYIEKTIEYTDTLHGFVESARTQNPSEPLLEFACIASGSKPSGNTKNNRIMRPPRSNQKNKVEDHFRKVKSSLNKMNSVSEPISNALVKHSVRNAKFESICAICNKCLFDANHDMCLIDFVNDVNVCSKSKSKRNKMRKVWKPTVKVFTDVGYKWKLTGRFFTIVGNSCPLTRITPKKIVHLKEATPKSVETPKPEIKVYSRRPKQIKSVGCPDCSLILKLHFGKTLALFRNLEGVDLLSGSRDTNLYIISLDDMLKTSSICLLSKASKTKSWLWHHHLSHLNFDTLNKLAKDGLARGIPKLKFQKDHLCSACTLGKSKKSSHQPKAEYTNQEKLYLLHMDLCGPMRMESINEKKYILLTTMASEQFSSGPGLHSMTPATSSSGLVPNPVSQQPFQEADAPRVVALTDSPMSTSIDQDAPSSSTPSTQEQEHSLNISQSFKESLKTPIFPDDPINESPHEESTSQGSSSNVRQTHTLFEHLSKWTKNHPIANVIGDPSRSIPTRKQLQTVAMWCNFDAFLTSVEPKNFKQAMTEPSWIDAMQEEIHEFQRLEVWLKGGVSALERLHGEFVGLKVGSKYGYPRDWGYGVIGGFLGLGTRLISSKGKIFTTLCPCDRICLLCDTALLSCFFCGSLVSAGIRIRRSLP